MVAVAHTVLTGTSFGNDARLAHALGEHGLADHIVDLVGAGMVEVFALQIDLGAAHFLRHAGRMVDRRGTADEVGQLVAEFGQEVRVVLVPGVGLAQLFEGMGQRFAGKAAAVGAEVAACIGVGVFKHR